MFIAYAVLAALLSLGLLASARAKLTHEERIATGLTGIGVPLSWFPYLAGLEIAGTVGLLAGLVYRPFGIAAATGVSLYFIGAVITHVRARDFKGLVTPGVILLVAVASLTLALLSA